MPGRSRSIRVFRVIESGCCDVNGDWEPSLQRSYNEAVMRDRLFSRGDRLRHGVLGRNARPAPYELSSRVKHKNGDVI